MYTTPLHKLGTPIKKQSFISCLWLCITEIIEHLVSSNSVSLLAY